MKKVLLAIVLIPWCVSDTSVCRAEVPTTEAASPVVDVQRIAAEDRIRLQFNYEFELTILPPS